MSLDVYLKAVRRTTIYDRNITHNLNRMAGEAGIYRHLWRPDEIGITKAAQRAREAHRLPPVAGGREP